MAKAQKKTTTETELAQSLDDNMDELQALALGAENFDDLVDLLEGRGFVAQIQPDGRVTPADPGKLDDEDAGRIVFAEGEPSTDDDAELPQCNTWRSIDERTGGDMAKGKSLANWLLGKRVGLVEKKSEAEEFAQRRIDDIIEWKMRMLRMYDRALGWYDHLLLSWHRKTGEKQIKLPNGSLTWDKARDVTEWDEMAGMLFALKQATDAGDAAAEQAQQDWALNDEDERSEEDVINNSWSLVVVGVMAELFTLKKQPVKDLLEKRQDGSYGYRDEWGEWVQVISVMPTGEVPRHPSDGTGIEMAAREWCKQGETYTQKIK